MKAVINRFLTGRWFVVIAPPSLYITHFMTYREAIRFVKQFDDPHDIVCDISGAFTKRYIAKTYPITDPYGK